MSLPPRPVLGRPSLNRREFLARTTAGAALLAASPLLARAEASAEASAAANAHARPAPSRAPRTSDLTHPHAAPKPRPLGLEMYSVRGAQAKDVVATLTGVRQIGYDAVEFYAPYLAWSPPRAKEIRAAMDDIGLRCYSTHNGIESLTPGDTMTKAIELNQILGARYIVLASPPLATGTVDEWKALCGKLSGACDALRPHGLFSGWHNHDAEWAKLATGERVMDVVAANTPADFMLQLDVGTCVKAGADPVAWINAHPGRLRSVHLKDWAPGTEANEKAYRVLFGEGVAPWKPIVTALESVGGVEFYLMEQEGSRFDELDTARRCFENWKTLRRTV